MLYCPKKKLTDFIFNPDISFQISFLLLSNYFSASDTKVSLLGGLGGVLPIWGKYKGGISVQYISVNKTYFLRTTDK